MTTIKKLFLLGFSIPFFSLCFSQNETNNWYFGSAAGLDFNSGIPVPLLNGTMVPTSEGSATMSDRTTGAFLLGTNGVNIWGRNLAVMPNGSGVGSNIAISSAQNSVIVPAPCSDSLFYVFTTDANENNYTNGLRYSVVDMTLNGGNGDVIVGQKNIPLITPACEKLAAVHDANGRDVWVVTIEVNTNKFYAYKVTAAGVSAPVISAIGRVYVVPDMPRAYLKFSPNGQKIFSVVGWFNGAAELFDFNNSTGVVSNRIGLDVHSYGASFSNNSQMLYAADNTQVFQYDISSNNAATILASKQMVGNVPGLMRAMQLGIDGKIYIANTSNNAFLSVINNPNVAGVGCNVSANSFSLGGRNAIFGLPNFIESYFDPAYTYVPCSMTASVVATAANCKTPCVGTATATGLGGAVPYSYLWSTNPVQTTQTATALCAGTYTVTITDANNVTATSTVLVTQSASPVVTPGSPLVLTGCINVSGTISASSNIANVTYSWNGPGIVSGGTTNNPTVNSAGTYTVIITDPITGCTDTATVLVTSSVSLPVVSANPLTLPCTQPTGLITAISTTPNATYSWSGPGIVSGGTTNNPTVNTSGIYTVTVTDPLTGCTNTATATVQINSGPTATVSSDIVIQLGDSVALTAGGGGTYNWIPSTNLSSANSALVIAAPTQTTTYCVEVTDSSGCKDTACVTIRVESPCLNGENLATPNAFSPNNDGVNDEFCLQGWDGCIENFSILIFDRWGEKVFESKDPNFCWDGKYRETVMDAQVVVYHIKATYLNLDKAIVKNGNISLIR